ncbi:MAG: type II secretion system F family protein [Sulfuricurvum sp.]|uniref:type II secretion system F family protein n=1 Tax=Sulfuricurvum sp. TaxID=2025608 RepID=UPI002630C0D1|nr:type II secretion system F family protein [Sulfuricurvum sp.]MDD2367790.1 type II secretion system F family protein [Sulfuricurvum sp.]MDD2951133.1 type II secretion system F family protein [Sulfuricurvum sp.]MDD5117969.1 type II secretion system F family protein [Sulfuricurvum sp.]
MKYFLVTILSKGKKTEQSLYAENKKEAHYLAKIKYSGMILKVAESSPPLEDQLRRFKESLFSNIKKRKLKQDALIAAIRQLAVMTNAGISIHDSLKEIADSTNDKVLQDVLGTMAEDINAGHSLSQSANKFAYELGNLSLAMIELGEKTGNMAEALHKLGDMLEEIRRNIIKFKKAMAYPRNVMIAMAIAFTILISYVVPKFKTMFDKFHAELPVPTKILLFLEHLFNTYGLYVLAGIFIFLFIFTYLINHYRNIRYKWHQVLLRTYLIKNIILYATLNRFTLVFSELVRAGIPIAEALETSIAMIDNLPLQERLLTVRSTVEKGGTLHNGLAETGLFENMIIQMISAGESSGQLDAMMEKVMEYYKMRFDAIIDGLSEAVEPIMLFVIAILVTLLALGIFLPMWDLGNAVQNKR